MKGRLTEIMDKFSHRRVLVVGGVILDRYIKGRVERISREAPVPVVVVNEERYSLGGAANAANNISSLGGEALLVGVIGVDREGKILKKELDKRNINPEYIVDDPDRKYTTQKTRIIVGNKHVARFDNEDKRRVEADLEKRVLDSISHLNGEVDIVLVSDYGQGLITRELMEHITSQGKNVIVDPRPQNKELYRGCNLITPNLDEASQIAGVGIKNDNDLKNVGNCLVDKYSCDVLITMGERGIALFYKKGGMEYVPTTPVEVYDVSGAGDTVAAALSLSIASGASLEEAAKIANIAAGIAVMKEGAASVSIREMREYGAD